MTYPEAIRALDKAARDALFTAATSEQYKTLADLLLIMQETKRLVDALPGHVKGK